MEYVGANLKYAFSSTGDFSFDTMDWDMVFIVGGNKATFIKRNIGSGFTISCDRQNMGAKPTSAGEWVFLLDSKFFGPGLLKAVIYARIPDEDFDPDEDFPTLESVRVEVLKINIETIEAL